MTMFAAIVLVLAATYSTGQLSSFNFRATNYFEDHMPFLEKYAMKGKCITPFEPYAVDFHFENTAYLLLVSSGSLMSYPSITLDNSAIWFGNSTYIFTYIGANTSDFKVHYRASIGTVKDNAFQSSECHVTAKSTGYIGATAKQMVKDYAGSSDILYVYPAKKWAVILHTLICKSSGTWDISASCPGADNQLVSELVDTVKKVELVKKRDVLHDTVQACIRATFSEIEVADYITN